MKLIKYLKPYWFVALMTPLFMIIEVVVDLIQPKMMSTIVDEGVLGGNMNLIITTGISMILLVILGGNRRHWQRSVCQRGFPELCNGSAQRRL